MEFEEEHAPHPFTSFNKQPREVPTLCGNWLEERALMSVTGTTRYQVRVVRRHKVSDSRHPSEGVEELFFNDSRGVQDCFVSLGQLCGMPHTLCVPPLSLPVWDMDTSY